MHMMLRDAQKKYDLLVLGGQRQRYQYFGFEKGGGRLCFTVTDTNVRHALADLPDDKLQLRLLTSENDAAMEFVHTLCAKQPMYCIRDDKAFLDIMHSWQGELYVLEENGSQAMSDCIRETLTRLAEEAVQKAGLTLDKITASSIVGNTAMHHLLLGIDPHPLVIPPYMPAVFEAIEKENGTRILPNIAGFVGADTVGCMVATRFDKLEELTLLIDIGTNGEMVLGDKNRRIACSTAAGPAFEGAKISCGMRGAPGAVDHVTVKDGVISYHVIGDVPTKGLCGSGLLDLVAALLDTEVLDESGYLEDKEYTLCENVTLTQKDIREVQLAKAAIRAGIELLCEKLGVEVQDIRQVFLAGAFGSFMDPRSACRIGMIPPVLLDKISAIGNAAGEGAKLCALSRAEYDYSKQLAANTEFLELASLPQFQDRYVDALEFEEEEE